MSVRVADEKKKKKKKKKVASLCHSTLRWMKIWWRLRFWNNPAVSNYPGPLVKKTGVRTLTVLHNHDNRESLFHRQTRSKSWPWQKALVPTVSFNAEFYGRRDTQSLGFCISLHRQPLLHREIVPPRETVAIARVAIAIVGRGGWGSLPYTVANENQMKA